MESVAHFNLDQLFELLALRSDALSFDQRVAELPFGGAVVKRQADGDAYAKIIEPVRAEVRQRLWIAADQVGIDR